MRAVVVYGAQFMYAVHFGFTIYYYTCMRQISLAAKIIYTYILYIYIYIYIYLFIYIDSTQYSSIWIIGKRVRG